MTAEKEKGGLKMAKNAGKRIVAICTWHGTFEKDDLLKKLDDIGIKKMVCPVCWKKYGRNIPLTKGVVDD